MPLPVVICQAQSQHIPILLSFWQKLDQSLPANDFGSAASAKQTLHSELAQQLTSVASGFALLAWHDKTAISCLCGHTYHKREATNTPVGLLYNLWVEPHYRRQKVASALVDEAEQRLKELGASSLQVAWRHSPAAESFWLQRGYNPYETMACKRC